jgi:2-polyprenyl-3-methyl-5-hydroxy-6-metoxy-1,4-benzoquinol methylase
MVDENDKEFMGKNRDHWDELVPIHVNTDFYGVDGFIAGENKLNQLEMGEVGPVDGKNLLHLQCHFGLDTLSWARLGAHVTGMDYSEAGIQAAKELAERCQLDARFVCCNLYDLPQNLLGQYDIVYTSYGVLAWLPDIPSWAQIAASYVKPGGFFYIAEFHPFAMVFDDESKELQYRYPYFEQKARRYEVKGSYADADAETKINEEFGWDHPIGEIVTALIESGLRIEFLHEFPYSVYQQLPILEPDGQGKWCFPKGQQPIPLIFSIKAYKN